MLSPLHLLLITAVLCIVMLLVLVSLLRSGTPGIKEWTTANMVAFAALLLFAERGVAPDFLSIEVANGLLAGATVYIGMRRFFFA